MMDLKLKSARRGILRIIGDRMIEENGVSGGRGVHKDGGAIDPSEQPLGETSHFFSSGSSKNKKIKIKILQSEKK